MNHYEICYRVLNSTETDWYNVEADNVEDAMTKFRRVHPYNMILAMYENKERV